MAAVCRTVLGPALRRVPVPTLSASSGPARPGRFLPPAAGGPARRSRSRPVRAAAGALAALLALACLLGATVTAQAQTDTTLVSTLEQTVGDSYIVGYLANNSFVQAQKFSTGGQSTRHLFAFNGCH